MHFDESILGYSYLLFKSCFICQLVALYSFWTTNKKNSLMCLVLHVFYKFLSRYRQLILKLVI